MGQRVQQDVPHGREVIIRLQPPVLPPPLVGLEELTFPLPDLPHPRLDGPLGELKEHTLTTDLRSGHPLRGLAGSGHPLLLGEVADFGVVAWRLDPGEPGQGADLAHPLGEDDLLDDLPIRHGGSTTRI